jgi:hypothetical protein
MTRRATFKGGLDVAPRGIRQAAWLDRAMKEAAVENTAFARAYNQARGGSNAQSKRVGDWRCGECSMSAGTAFHAGVLLRRLGATTTGALALYAAGHLAEYIRSLRLQAQTKVGAANAITLHVFGELLVELQIADEHRWLHAVRPGVQELLDQVEEAIRHLPTDEPDPTVREVRRLTFETPRLYAADPLMQFALAGAKDRHIWTASKRSLIRATLRVWRHQIAGRSAPDCYAMADAAFDALDEVPEHTRIQKYIFDWGRRHGRNIVGDLSRCVADFRFSYCAIQDRDHWRWTPFFAREQDHASPARDSGFVQRTPHR